MSSAATSQQIRLSDGRKLGFAEYGDLEGTPVFYFHGWPGSRRAGQDLDPIASRWGARVIAPDRPGMGLSDYQPRRSILDWPNDVVELADSLKVARFALVGTSGGAAYVASCALKIPERLTRVAIVSGLGPFDAPEVKESLPLHLRRLSFASRKTPWIMRFFLKRWRNLALRNPERFLARSFALFSSTETSLLTRADGGQNYLAGFVEAHRFGTQGSTYDMSLLARPWGFSPAEITTTVYLWHGEADRAAPAAMGRYLASTMPNCQAKFLPGEGHTTLFLNHADEIFGVLIS